MDLNGRWNLDSLKAQVTGTLANPDREKAILWCQNVGILPKRKYCRTCRKDYKIVNNQPYNAGAETCIGKVFRCQSRTHDKHVSLAKDTWLEENHLPLEKGLTLMY